MNPLNPRTLLRGRFAAVRYFILLFLACALITRLILMLKAKGEVTWDGSLLASFGWGLVFDLGAALWLSLPLTLLLTFLPARSFGRSWVRMAFYIGVFGLGFVLFFQGVAEWFFWDEFGTRFNFIAVDYLVYTTEVLDNIQESYPLALILPSIGVGAMLLVTVISRSGIARAWMETAEMPWRTRIRTGLGHGAVAVGYGLLLSSGTLPKFHNAYNRSLAMNGSWSLCAAFRNPVLDYREFYASIPDDESFGLLQDELTADGSSLLNPGQRDTLRFVDSTSPEKRPNIIQITVESLSANLMGLYNPDSDRTPHLDALADKCLLFDNFFATGTRTVRGMEALTLSIPPTPGRSIVKRLRNEDMFTLGSVLRTKGYDTAFLYGGFGYFDNMNAFFGGNGFRTIDRSNASDEDISFSNAWGACDQDLLNWTLREADLASAKDAPFHFFVMTTSNHRPYTYPDGFIDLPSKVSGRRGAVKYTDFAINEFLESASQRPWFEDTIFVIVADHCAGSAGRTQIPLERYHIPLMIYAPGGQIAPGHVTTLTSQMDYAPTLLGLLGWSYASRFFGQDVNRIDAEDGRALVGTYQLLGNYRGQKLTILEPKKDVAGYSVERPSFAMQELDPAAEDRLETISYFQSASWMYDNDVYRALSTEQQAEYARARASVAPPASRK